MLRDIGFRLRKWYLDCVTPEGAVFVGYAARIGLGPIPLSYQATMWSPPAGAGCSEFTMLPARLPSSSRDGVRWESARLAARGRWCGRPSSACHVLLDTASHYVAWRCCLPACEASVELGGRTLQGRGYVEELVVHGNPGKLPIRELHWGRFSSGGDHVVWIEWVGPHPLRLVTVNGLEVAATRVDEEEVRLTDGRLTFEDTRVIRAEAAGVSAFGAPRWRRMLLPRRLADMREEKWLSRGTLERSDGSRADGWVLHERVTWP